MLCHSLLQWWQFFPELFTVACLSWLTLHGMAHSFLELCKPLCHNKAVIHLGVSFASLSIFTFIYPSLISLPSTGKRYKVTTINKIDMVKSNILDGFLNHIKSPYNSWYPWSALSYQLKKMGILLEKMCFYLHFPPFPPCILYLLPSPCMAI